MVGDRVVETGPDKTNIRPPAGYHRGSDYTVVGHRMVESPWYTAWLKPAWLKPTSVRQLVTTKAAIKPWLATVWLNLRGVQAG